MASEGVEQEVCWTPDRGKIEFLLHIVVYVSNQHVQLKLLFVLNVKQQFINHVYHQQMMKNQRKYSNNSNKT